MRGDLGTPEGTAGAVADPTTWRALIRGLTRRCPRCGQGKLFRHWLKIVPTCPRCGLVFGREDGAFLGSLALNYGVTGAIAIAFVAVMLARTLPDPPAFAITAGAVAITLLVPLVFYPFAKTTWAAIDVLMHRSRQRT